MSDWPTIAITGAVALVASLGAVFLKEHLDRRRSLRERRDAAFQRLATAVAVLLVRVEVLRSDMSWRQSASEALLAIAPLSMASLYSIIPKRWRKGPIGAIEVANLIRTPEPHVRFDYSYQAMIDALTTVVEARTELELVGSRADREEASKLIAACLKFVEIAGQRTWPWQTSAATHRLDEQRAFVVQARDRYVASVLTPKDRLSPASPKVHRRLGRRHTRSRPDSP